MKLNLAKDPGISDDDQHVSGGFGQAILHNQRRVLGNQRVVRSLELGMIPDDAGPADHVLDKLALWFRLLEVVAEDLVCGPTRKAGF